MTAFIIALGAVLITAFLQISTTDLQIARNTRYSIRALYIADAGVEDALYELTLNKNWSAGFSNKAFAGDSYTVTVTDAFPNPIVFNSVGTVTGGFQRRIEVQCTISGSDPPVIGYWKEL
jgi:hypothetical protein